MSGAAAQLEKVVYFIGRPWLHFIIKLKSFLYKIIINKFNHFILSQANNISVCILLIYLIKIECKSTEKRIIKCAIKLAHIQVS